MKTFSFLLIIVLLTASNNSNGINIENKQNDPVSAKNKNIGADTTSKRISSQKKVTVIVLPPYDKIANAGISPNIQKYLEIEVLKDTSLALIKFPFNQLRNIPYQNVYDKKYCKPIVDNTKADIIIMSKLDHVTSTGNMKKDTWNFKIRIYSVKTGKQINSSVTGFNLTDNNIQNILADKQQRLIKEIISIR